MNLIAKIFGTKHDRDIKSVRNELAMIKLYYAAWHDFSDNPLITKIPDFPVDGMTTLDHYYHQWKSLTSAETSPSAESLSALISAPEFCFPALLWVINREYRQRYPILNYADELILDSYNSALDKEEFMQKPLLQQIKLTLTSHNLKYDDFQTAKNALLQACTPLLAAQTNLWKQLLTDIRQNVLDYFEGNMYAENYATELRKAIDEKLNEILPLAYALAREACYLLLGETYKVADLPVTWDMVPYDVQLIGGVALHRGNIAEMATGEGKTLVATMPLYLNALAGLGCHLITVNDYLARRDAEWNGPLYSLLGLKVDYIQNDYIPNRRQIAYGADITYGTNSEFGFDYLRDNMAWRPEDRVQRGHHFCIVDEVDSVLIDEARTPLIISGIVEQAQTEQYTKLKPRIQSMVMKQTSEANQKLSEAIKTLENSPTADDEYHAIELLLQVQHCSPKNKKLLKFLEDGQYTRIISKVEADYMRDKKMNLLNEELYYTLDEKGQSININERGHEILGHGEEFILPDITTMLQEIDSDESLNPLEKEQKRTEAYKTYSEAADRLHSIHQLLKAFVLFEKDVEYVVQDKKVMIVDEFTGRLMPGRRYSDGLHQALEAKEGVTVEAETQTLATITIQNYFRLYRKLAGMTGTAETEASEFIEIYKLDVKVTPTNQPIRRIDHEDQVYRSKREKFSSVMIEVLDLWKRKRPVLVGTVSVDVSELLSRMFSRFGIQHSVLNAKQHQREAEIVTEAGRPGTVTIATNMAGRGTDIKLALKPLSERITYIDEYLVWIKEELDNNKFPQFSAIVEKDRLELFKEIIRKVKLNELGLSVEQSLTPESREKGKELRRILCEKCCIGCEDDCNQCYKQEKLDDCYEDPPCGLAIVGTERHEARRIDRQLRGRSGRQGDPGSSIFFISLEDDLMRLFGQDRIAAIMSRMGLKEGEVITHRMVTNAIGRAQQRVEYRNFEIRKRLLEYDDVMNQQREVVYALRQRALDGEDMLTEIETMLQENIDEVVPEYVDPKSHPDYWDFDGLHKDLLSRFFVDIKFGDDNKIKADKLKDSIKESLIESYKMRRNAIGIEQMQQFERAVMLKVIDEAYRDHLYAMDRLKEGIGLRAYGQKDPLLEYKQEGFQMFLEYLDRIRKEILSYLFAPPRPQSATPSRARARVTATDHSQMANWGGAQPQTVTNAPDGPAKPKTVKRETPKVGRNEPCPCGSGKKYKHCHGLNQS